MSNDEIQYRHEDIQAGVQAMQRVTNEIKTEVEQLIQDTRSSQAFWEASSAESYNQLSANISKDFEDINQVMVLLQQSVSDGQVSMAEMDKMAAKNFEN